jgi:hypothetical protein
MPASVCFSEAAWRARKPERELIGGRWPGLSQVISGAAAGRQNWRLPSCRVDAAV